MGAEKSEELCTVPNLIGLTASQANQALTNAGLIMKTAGASGDDSGVRVISQSHGEEPSWRPARWSPCSWARAAAPAD